MNAVDGVIRGKLYIQLNIQVFHELLHLLQTPKKTIKCNVTQKGFNLIEVTLANGHISNGFRRTVD